MEQLPGVYCTFCANGADGCQHLRGMNTTGSDDVVVRQGICTKNVRGRVFYRIGDKKSGGVETGFCGLQEVVRGTMVETVMLFFAC